MFVGFDTSNYTTSIALFDGQNVTQYKKLLEVKLGQRGLRQSEAVFQHTVNIPSLLEQINLSDKNIQTVSVSSRPRNIATSYMPCFLVGVSNAQSVAKFSGAKFYKTSHQIGHILSALYSVNRLDLIYKKFIAFHISGGTTEVLLVQSDKNEIINVQIVAQSTDLNAGQAIDRIGVMLGLKFPCGKEIERLAQNSNKDFNIKPTMIGLDCSLSGVENKAKKLLEMNESKENISKFVLTYICNTIDKMTQGVISEYGELPLVYSGGVMSNKYIKSKIQNKYNAYFAQPEFSCDNAAGIAIYGYLKSKNDSSYSFTS